MLRELILASAPHPPPSFFPSPATPTSPAASVLEEPPPHQASLKPQASSMSREQELPHSQTESTSLTDVFQHEEHVQPLEELPSTLEPPIVWHITPEHQLLILQTSLSLTRETPALESAQQPQALPSESMATRSLPERSLFVHSPQPQQLQQAPYMAS